MADLAEGESVKVQGSAREPYVLKNVGGVYSCSCPAWRNQSLGIERRTCKHLRAFRGEQAEHQRLGELPPSKSKEESDASRAAPALLLARTWSDDVDPAGWWLSEKLDGVRAYFDGRRFVSRLGNVFYAPDWFTAGLPDTPLDGELWLARQSFPRTMSIVRRRDGASLWRELTYLVFDAPSLKEPFERRLQFLAESFARRPAPFARAHLHERCRNGEHLREELRRIEELGGEGVMLRQPGSPYEPGRSHTLLKVKSFRDAEARVVAHLPGTGRHRGRLGALAVELPDGTPFSVGTGFSDAQRSDPPPIGSVITFRYQELSERGVPRFPSFLRVSAEEPATAPPTRPTGGSSAARPMTSNTKENRAMRRRFEFTGGSSNKFWEVRVAGSDVIVHYGRIGTSGQSLTKSLPSDMAAANHADKLIREKTNKGYVEA